MYTFHLAYGRHIPCKLHTIADTQASNMRGKHHTNLKILISKLPDAEAIIVPTPGLNIQCKIGAIPGVGVKWRCSSHCSSAINRSLICLFN